MTRRNAQKGSGNRGRRRRPRTQREILRAVLLRAAGKGSGPGAANRGGSPGPERGWMTLEELAEVTNFGEASISAQLRHLRKPGCGAFVVEKRPREAAGMARPEQAGVLWEYKLWPGRRRGRVR